MSIVPAAELALELAAKVGSRASTAEAAYKIMSREATDLLAGTAGLSKANGPAATALYREGQLVSNNGLSLFTFSDWPFKTMKSNPHMFEEANYLRHCNTFHLGEQVDRHLGVFAHQIPTPSGQMLRVTTDHYGQPSVGYFKYSTDSEHFLSGTRRATGSGNDINMNVVSTGRHRDVAFKDTDVHYKYGHGNFAPGWTDSSKLSPIHSIRERNFWPSQQILREATLPNQVISNADRAGFNARVGQLAGAEVQLPMGEKARLVGIDPFSLEAIVWKPASQLQAAQNAMVEVKQLYRMGQTPNKLDFLLRDAKGAIYHKEGPNMIVRVDGYSVAQPSEVYLPRMNEKLSKALHIDQRAGLRGQGTYEAAKDGSTLDLNPSLMGSISRPLPAIGA